MSPLIDSLRTRLLPSFLTAMGVMLLTVGLSTYFGLPTAGANPPPTGIVETLAPTVPPPTATPTATPGPSATIDPGPTPEPTERVRAFASRVAIPALDIDLPVIKGNKGYPLCDVAMYLRELAQPGEDRAVYLYAHARTDMFLPILDASKIQNGRPMLGMEVLVWTTDELLFRYEIFEVRRHQTELDDALAARQEQLWLQTSEGPRGTPGKTQVIARLVSVAPAEPGESKPKPRPVVCG
jgi:sortase (surface protein transpeptidase)